MVLYSKKAKDEGRDESVAANAHYIAKDSLHDAYHANDKLHSRHQIVCAHGL